MQGHGVRLVDLPVGGAGMPIFRPAQDAPDKDALRQDVMNMTKRYSGVVGPAFVTELLKSNKIAKFRQFYLGYRGFMMNHCPQPPSNVQQRITERFAAVMAAGVFAQQTHIINWPLDAPTGGISAVFQLWLETQNHSAAHTAAVERTMAFCRTHLDRFISFGEAVGADHIGFRTETALFITEQTWIGTVHQGFDPLLSARALDADNLLIRTEADRWTSRLPPSLDPKRTRAYQISLAGVLGQDVTAPRTTARHAAPD